MNASKMRSIELYKSLLLKSVIFLALYYVLVAAGALGTVEVSSDPSFQAVGVD